MFGKNNVCLSQKSVHLTLTSELKPSNNETFDKEFNFFVVDNFFG
jgi:hypothetical protein